MTTEDKDLEFLEQQIVLAEQQSANEESRQQVINLLNEENKRSYPIRLILILLGILVLLGAWTLYYYNVAPALQNRIYTFIAALFTWRMVFYISVGLAAQMVDGALGMAYGATSSAFLLGLGVSPAVASASVHVAEVFTTGASGISHFRLGNVNKKLFRYLVIPGVIGALLGAYLLSNKLDGDIVKPYMSIYLMILGTVILFKAFRKPKPKSKTKRLGPLAFFGGFMDSIGGGGWGPIVTSTLVSKGRSIPYTVGSVNAAEFFISFASAGMFLFFKAIDSWQVIIGLIIGGVVASPFAALLVKKLKRKPLMIMVGILVILLSLKTILFTWLIK